MWSKITSQFARVGLMPRSRVARVTAYLAGIAALLLLLKWIFRWAGAATIAVPLDQWSRFVGFVLVLLLLFLALRWFRRHVMWSVRNRLIVTYLFIGVLPVVLVALIATLSVFLLAGQLSSFLAASEIQSQLESLHAENSASAHLLAARRSAKQAEHLQADDTVFPGRTVQLLPASSQPAWIKDGFRSLVLDDGKAYLRAADVVNSGSEKLMVVSSVPFDRGLLSKIAAGLGPLSLYVVHKENSEKDANVNIDLREGAISINGKPAAGVSAGVLPEARNRWDKEFTFYSVTEPLDWKTGATTGEVVLAGSMRASSLYARLATSTNKWWTDLVFIALAVLAGLFGVIVLIAWLIGIRLTRTVTYSVANLYKATEHINRGDFTHRIKVREKDQLAALQIAFNSMTESLQKLIAEQKEKERLQSELEIAHEVQSQLFPQDVSGTRTLELYGACRPARIVSGDYYDFLSYGPEQMGIAVGDISGKGISAALLMATIHSAVRAYEQEQLAPAGKAISLGKSGGRTISVAPRIVKPSPAQMLWLLNRHLYQSTQPEKYATLFLGFYDDESRRLTYSNAGHLPPVILGQDGSTRRLDTGGTVVGLFDDLGYEEQTVSLNPGDLFIAFSDGMTEPENDFGEFGEERLIETIYSCRHLPLDRISENAIGAVQDWIGSVEQPDDVTLVLARRIA